MDPYQEIERRVTAASSLEDLVAALDFLLSGGFAVLSDGQLYSIKQLVAKINGLRVQVFSREHAPPHFHVSGGGIDAAFAVEDGRHLWGDIDGRNLKLVQWWYARGRRVLVKAWNETRPTDCQVGGVEA